MRIWLQREAAEFIDQQHDDDCRWLDDGDDRVAMHHEHDGRRIERRPRDQPTR